MIGTNRNPEGGVHDVPLSNSRLIDEGGDRTPSTGAGAKLRVLSLAEILDESGVEWLIDQVLPRDSVALLYSAPGLGKTFLALDLAVSIASGTRWFGRKTCEGMVFYIAAEGCRGLRQRLIARLGGRVQDRTDPIFERLRVLPHAVNFLDARAQGSLLAVIKAIPEKPALVVIDTLARCTVGGDENSVQHMGMFIEGCDRLRAETGATVLVLHHSVKRGEGERGSSALSGAVETKLEITKEDGVRKLSCLKQKDGEPFDPEYFRLVPVVVDVKDDASEVTSCIVEQLVEPPIPQQGPRSDPASGETSGEPNGEYMIRWKLQGFGTEGALGPELRELTGLDDSTFYRHLGHLRESGEIEIVPGPKPTRYRFRREGSDSHSQPPLGSDENETGHSQAQSRATVGGETESEAETGPERDLYGDRNEGTGGYHGD